MKTDGFTLALIITLLVLQGALWGNNGGLTKQHHLMLRKEQINQEIQELRDFNQQLQRETVSLKTESNMIEEIAREELGMVKSGEVFFRPFIQK